MRYLGFCVVCLFSLSACSGIDSNQRFIDIVKKGKADHIREALDRGENANQRDEDGISVLHWAAAETNNTDVITLLLDAGADLEARDAYQMTPLHWDASQNENPDILWTLINAGADINAEADLRVTPLMIAAGDNKSPDIVFLLLEKGADPRKRDERGWTARDYIKNNKKLQGSEAYEALRP